MHAALRRALALDPAARFPAMPALLAALARDPGARRRRAAVAGLAALGATAAIAWAVAGDPDADPVGACAAAPGELARALPVATSDALVQAVRDAGAGERADAIAQVIGEQRARAAAVANAACLAHARHTWSDELAAASHECLLDHARTVEAMLTTPSPMRGGADLVVFALQLPDVERCGDARGLAGWRALAADPRELDLVTSARARLASGIARLEVGQLAPARALLDEVARSPVATAPAVRGRAEPCAPRSRSRPAPTPRPRSG